jgi:hypothetical protein
MSAAPPTTPPGTPRRPGPPIAKPPKDLSASGRSVGKSGRVGKLSRRYWNGASARLGWLQSTPVRLG